MPPAATLHKLRSHRDQQPRVFGHGIPREAHLLSATGSIGSGLTVTAREARAEPGPTRGSPGGAGCHAVARRTWFPSARRGTYRMRSRGGPCPGHPRWPRGLARIAGHPADALRPSRCHRVTERALFRPVFEQRYGHVDDHAPYLAAGSHEPPPPFSAVPGGCGVVGCVGCVRTQVRATPTRTRAIPASMVAVTVSPSTTTPSTIATTGSR